MPISSTNPKNTQSCRHAPIFPRNIYCSTSNAGKAEMPSPFQPFRQPTTAPGLKIFHRSAHHYPLFSTRPFPSVLDPFPLSTRPPSPPQYSGSFVYPLLSTYLAPFIRGWDG